MNPWAIVTSNQCHYNLQYWFPYYNFARGGKWNWNKQQFKIIVFALKLTGTESTLQEESKGSKYLNGQSKGSLVKKLIKKKASSCCSKKILYKRLPVLNFIRNYNLDFFISDMLAGLTVGLTAVPQGIAYAVVAGLEPQVTTWFWLFFMNAGFDSFKKVSLTFYSTDSIPDSWVALCTSFSEAWRTSQLDRLRLWLL